MALDPKVSVNISMAKLPFAKFKKMHEKDHPNDDAKERYLLIGGKLPKKEKQPEKE